MTRHIDIEYTKGQNYNHNNDTLSIIITVSNESVSIKSVNDIVDKIQEVLLK